MCFFEIEDTDPTLNFTFDCKHTFHAECVHTSFKDFVERGEINKLNCLNGCNPENPVKATVGQLETLFKNDSDLIKRYKMLTDKKKLESDPLMRYCPQPKCDGIIKAKDKTDKKIDCPVCHKSVCF